MKKCFYSQQILFCLMALFGCSLGAMGQTPIAYYPFSGNANDAIGTRHGTVLNATLAPDRFGNANSAYDFNGSSSEIDLFPQPFPDMTNMTITAWVQINTGGGGCIFSDMDWAGGNDLHFNLDQNGIFVRADKNGGQLGNGSSNGLVSFSTPLSNTWHHVAWTLAPSQSKVYLDGVLIQTIDVTGSNIGYHNAAIGVAANHGWWWFNGKIDELAIFDTTLTDSQVAANLTSACTVVTNTNDSGVGSLRAAIECANNNLGADEITFAIPDTGQHIINLASSLPSLTDAGTYINGGGWLSNAPQIKIIGLPNDSLKVIGADIKIEGLELDKVSIKINNANNATIKHNCVKNSSVGIEMTTSSASAMITRNEVANNEIGVNILTEYGSPSIIATHNAIHDNAIAGIKTTSNVNSNSNWWWWSSGLTNIVIEYDTLIHNGYGIEELLNLNTNDWYSAGGFTLNNNVIQDNTNTGIHISCQTGSGFNPWNYTLQNVAIHHNKITNNANHGIEINTSIPIYGLNLNNNLLLNNTNSGIKLRDTLYGSFSNLIVSNDTINNNSTGIEISGNNNYWGWGYGGTINTNQINNNITGINVQNTNNGWGGGLVINTNQINSNVTGIKVQNNNNNGGGYGFAINTNKINNNVTGIELSGSNYWGYGATINANQINNNSSAGIKIASGYSSLTISNDTINNNGYGIEMSGYIDGTTIHHNLIHNNSNTGIHYLGGQYQGITATVANNIITNNKYGIDLKYGNPSNSYGLNINSNYIHNNTNTGLRIFATNSYIYGIGIAGNSIIFNKDGIDINTAGASIYGLNINHNTIDTNSNIGVKVVGENNNSEISYNKINKNYNGIILENSWWWYSLTINHNLIHENTNIGLSASGTSIGGIMMDYDTITNNNRGIEIVVTSEFMYSTISHCLIKENAATGVKIEAGMVSDLTIIDNSVSNNNAGIYISSTIQNWGNASMIKNNQINDNPIFGLKLALNQVYYYSSFSIDNNSFKNSAIGIDIPTSGTNMWWWGNTPNSNISIGDNQPNHFEGNTTGISINSTDDAVKISSKNIFQCNTQKDVLSNNNIEIISATSDTISGISSLINGIVEIFYVEACGNNQQNKTLIDTAFINPDGTWTLVAPTGSPFTAGALLTALATPDFTQGTGPGRNTSKFATFKEVCLPPVVSTLSNTICQGTLGLTLSTGTRTGTKYVWTGPNGFSYSSTSSNSATVTAGSVTSSLGGVYNVSVYSGDCITDKITITVVVNPLPVFQYPGIAFEGYHQCAGTSFTLPSQLVNPGSGTAPIVYTWQLNNSAIVANPYTIPSLALSHTGAYKLIATDANACSATITISLTVNAIPIVYALDNAGTYCQSVGITPSLSNSQAAASAAGMYYIYLLTRNMIPIDTLLGTGNALTFSHQTQVGTYRVMAIYTNVNSFNSPNTIICSTLMSDSIVIDTNCCTFVVSNANPSGYGSLYDAIVCANNDPNPNTISFASALTIPVTTTLTLESGNSIIDGNGTAPTRIKLIGTGTAALTLNGTSTIQGLQLDNVGILLASTSSDVVIQHNVLMHNQNAIEITSGSSNVSIIQNSFFENNSSVFNLGSISSLRANTFVGTTNTLTGSASGFAIFNSNNITSISDSNSFTSCYYGIYNQGDLPLITGNVFTNDTFAITNVSNTEMTIENNVFSGSREHCILLGHNNSVYATKTRIATNNSYQCNWFLGSQSSVLEIQSPTNAPTITEAATNKISIDCGVNTNPNSIVEVFKVSDCAIVGNRTIQTFLGVATLNTISEKWELLNPSVLLDDIITAVVTPYDSVAIVGSTSIFAFAQTVVAPAILPVRVVKLYAKATSDKQIRVTWQTASEQNSKEFVVEHSTNGLTFKDIGTVASQGDSYKTQSYSFLHDNPKQGLNYYRLRQIDKDKHSELFGPVTATLSETDELHVFLYPNPLSSGQAFFLQFSSPQAFELLKIRCFDLTGKLLDIAYNQTDNNDLVLVQPQHALPPGLYLVEVTKADGNKETLRVVVQ